MFLRILLSWNLVEMSIGFGIEMDDIENEYGRNSSNVVYREISVTGLCWEG